MTVGYNYWTLCSWTLCSWTRFLDPNSVCRNLNTDREVPETETNGVRTECQMEHSIKHVSTASRSRPAFHQPRQAKTISREVKLSSALMEFDASRYGLQVWNKREKVLHVSLTTLNLGSSTLLYTVSPQETITALLDVVLRWNIQGVQGGTCQASGECSLSLKYTDITQNTYIQSWTVTEIMAREVWNFDSCYTLIDYQIHIETGSNMWFL